MVRQPTMGVGSMGSVEQSIITLISQTGFPIVVSVYLLVKVEKRLDKLIQLLTVVATRLKVPQNDKDDVL
jgi:hypothetical protein